MQELTVNFAPDRGQEWHRMSVPNITTALVVAQINLDHGLVQIRDGERVLATMEKQGRGIAPFWQVG